MRKRLFNVSLFTAISICLLGQYACKFSVLYEKAEDIPKGLWSVNSPVTFAVPITDTLNYYSIVFSLRNNNNYPYSNLFLFVDTYSPAGNSRRDTIEMTLANIKGKWLGKGISGVWQNKFYFRKNIRFPQSGEYKIKISQAMRDKSLEGIMDVGIKIEPFKQD
jgi:gliding motility-associated lipoprotein GldH